MDLLYQGWAILFNSRGAGAWFWFSSDSGELPTLLSSTDTDNPSLASGTLA